MSIEQEIANLISEGRDDDEIVRRVVRRHRDEWTPNQVYDLIWMVARDLERQIAA